MAGFAYAKHPFPNPRHNLPTTHGPTMREAAEQSTSSLLSPGVARYCDSGLRTHAAHPDYFSESEKSAIRYGSRKPCYVEGRVHITSGPPAGYYHGGACELTPGVRQFIRREDLQELHASDSGNALSGDPLRRIDIGKDPLGGPTAPEAIQRSVEFQRTELPRHIALDRHIVRSIRQKPWDACQY